MNEHTRKVGIAADAVKMEGRSQAFFEHVENEVGWPHAPTFRDIAARVPQRSDVGREPMDYGRELEDRLPEPPA